MYVDSEFFSDSLSQLAARNRRVLPELLDQKPLDLRCELPRLLWPAFAVGQCGYPLPMKGLRGGVEGFARVSVLSACLRDIEAVNERGSEHLVLDLDLVTWVEKVALLKQLALDITGSVVPRPGRLEEVTFA